MMKSLKRLIVQVFFLVCRMLLPKKYYDVFYVPKFLEERKLKGLSLGKKIWCFIHGFLPHEYLYYDLKNNDHRNYIPARNNYQKNTLNGIFSPILSNKILFENHIKTVIDGIDKLHVIRSIGFIERGYLKSLHKDVIQGELSSILPFLEKTDLIMKPIDMDGGVGIFLIRKEGDHFLFDDKKASWNEIITLMTNLNNYLIQKRFTQHGFSNEIYSGVVNTMRIATMIDPISQKPFIAYAVHRFGSPQTRNVDNMCQGGIVAKIDVNDGRLSEGQYFSSNGEKKIVKSHPLSLKPIYNKKIPNWSNLTNRLIELAKRMPYLKYVGWDIILSDDELYMLEGNISPDLELIQMFKAMKDIPSSWSFFKFYKYI